MATRSAPVAHLSIDTIRTLSIRARVAIEAGATFGWHRWVGSDGAIVGISRFGASAPAEEVFRQYGFTPDDVAREARALLER